MSHNITFYIYVFMYFNIHIVKKLATRIMHSMNVYRSFRCCKHSDIEVY